MDISKLKIPYYGNGMIYLFIKKNTIKVKFDMTETFQIWIYDWLILSQITDIWNHSTKDKSQIVTFCRIFLLFIFFLYIPPRKKRWEKKRKDSLKDDTLGFPQESDGLPNKQKYWLYFSYLKKTFPSLKGVYLGKQKSKFNYYWKKKITSLKNNFKENTEQASLQKKWEGGRYIKSAPYKLKKINNLAFNMDLFYALVLLLLTKFVSKAPLEGAVPA